MTVATVIVAAGRGERFGGPKLFVPLGGVPLLLWSCRAFTNHPGIHDVVVVLPPEIAGEPPDWLSGSGVRWCSGGPTRRDSVGRGIAAAPAADVILVHDGARPLVSSHTIDRVLQAVAEKGAALPVLEITDTIKRVRAGDVVGTVDRSELGRAQTPQGFRAEMIREAHAWAASSETDASDDVALCELRGHAVAAVAGDRWNLKITTSADLELAEWLITSGRVRAPDSEREPDASV